MKDNKATGDGIQRRRGSMGGSRWGIGFGGCVGRIWKQEGWIKDWNERIIVPLVKKGEGVRIEDYRGVMLTPTLYKVYASVLVNRLR